MIPLDSIELILNAFECFLALDQLFEKLKQVIDGRSLHTAQRIQTLFLIQADHSQSMKVSFQPNAQAKTENLRLNSQPMGLAVIDNVGEEMLVDAKPHDLDVFIFLQCLLFEAFGVVSVDVGDKDNAALITFPGVVVGLWCWYLGEVRDYGSSFLQKLSPCVFLVVIVVGHACGKLKSKAMHGRPEFHDHQKLRLPIFVPDDGNDVNSIDLALLGSSPENLLVSVHALSDRIINQFHAQPFPSVYLGLFDNLALFVRLVHCQIQDMRII